MNPFDLFIIHVAADARVALELALDFERLGYRAWCYELDSLPGSNYIENIRRGIEAATVLLVLVSRRSLERGEEVTREIHFGQAGDKPFIPVVLGMSDAEFDRTVPLTWRQAFGEAVRVQVRSGRADEATRRIAAGLNALGAKAREVDGADERIRTIVKMIEGSPPPGDPTDPEKGGTWWPRHGQRVVRWSVLVAAIAIVAALVMGQLPALRRRVVPPQKQPHTLTIWIVDPTLQGFGDRELEARMMDYGSLRRIMEEDLLKIADANSTVMQILNDHEIDMALVNAGCPDISKKFQIPECSEKKAFDLLEIRAKIAPTFQGSADGKGELTLRIGKGGGVMMLPHSSLADANLTTLADWSAEQIARFLSVPQERIAGALVRQRENSRLLEDSLGSAAPTAHDGKTSWLPSLVASAFAEQPPTAAEADIRHVLDRLRGALETEDTAQVAAVFSAMAPEQQTALQRYFANVADLKVAFGPPEITVLGDTARAAFLRQDQFKDKQSGEKTSLAIRLVAVLVRENGTWKVQSLQKPT
jgi:hypothetical protein